MTLVMAATPVSVAQAAPKASKASPSKPSKTVVASDRAAAVSFQVNAPTAEPLKLSLKDAQLADTAAVGFAPREVGSPQARVEGQFALSPAATFGDVRLLDADRYYDGRGPVSWRSNAFVVGQTDGGAVDSVRVSVAAVARNAAIAPLSLVRPDAQAFDAENIDVTLTRGWPSAVKLAAGKYALDFSPHAGFGFGPHACLGASLARLELRILFEELIPHLKTIELAGPPKRLEANFLSGIKSMPIRFTKN